MPTEMSRKQGGTHTHTLTYNLMHTKFMNSTEHFFYITLPQLSQNNIWEQKTCNSLTILNILVLTLGEHC